jgi:hypothetical protein
MARKRYRKHGISAFLGDCPYERTVPESLLRQLDGLVDWEVFADGLVRLCRGKARVGKLPCNPSMTLKQPA